MVQRHPLMFPVCQFDSANRKKTKIHDNVIKNHAQVIECALPTSSSLWMTTSAPSNLQTIMSLFWQANDPQLLAFSKFLVPVYSDLILQIKQYYHKFAESILSHLHQCVQVIKAGSHPAWFRKLEDDKTQYTVNYIRGGWSLDSSHLKEKWDITRIFTRLNINFIVFSVSWARWHCWLLPSHTADRKKKKKKSNPSGTSHLFQKVLSSSIPWRKILR